MTRSASSNCKNRILCVIFVIIILLLCVLTFTACDENDEANISSTEYGLRLVGYYYGEDGSTVYAVVGLTSDDGLNCAPATAEGYVQKENAFFNLRKTELTLSPASIFSAVADGMTQQVWVRDGITHNVLKIVFRYDTIYKSVKADGKLTRSGKYYLYSYLLDETAETKTVNVVSRSQNSANWYSALLLGAAIVAVAGVATAILIKGKLCRKTAIPKE